MAIKRIVKAALLLTLGRGFPTLGFKRVLAVLRPRSACRLPLDFPRCIVGVSYVGRLRDGCRCRNIGPVVDVVALWSLREDILGMFQVIPSRMTYYCIL